MKTRTLIGIVVVLCLVLAGLFAFDRERAPANTRTGGLTLEGFKTEYKDASDVDREAIAARYLTAFSASDLLTAADQIFPVCHFQAHPIGRAVYEKDQNFQSTLSQCTSSCSDACFHGVLMAMFKMTSDNFGGVTDDVPNEKYIQFVVDQSHDLCARPEVEDVVKTPYCLHGIGHVFAYASGYNLGSAIGMCKTLKNDVQAKFCSGGVYMEYMMSRKYDEELEQKDFYPCENAGYMTETCFRYKGFHMIRGWGSPGAAIDACRTLSYEKKIYCIRGVAFWASSKTPLDTPDALDGLCGRLTDPDEHNACLYGSVFFISANTDPQTTHGCNVLAPQFKTICLRQLESLHAVTNDTTQLSSLPSPTR